MIDDCNNAFSKQRNPNYTYFNGRLFNLTKSRLYLAIINTIALSVSYDECDGELVRGVLWYECIEK